MKIILIGPGCSGKDYLSSYLESKGLIKSVAYTTRPKRENEIDGKDYHYVNISTFNKMKNTDKFYEFDEFNTWYYGSTIEDFEKCNLFIKTPRGISKLKPEDRKNCYIIYLNMPEDVIKQRMSERNDSNDNIDRRIKADKDQFDNFTDFDLQITDADYDIKDVEAIVRFWLEDKFSLYESYF